MAWLLEEEKDGLAGEPARAKVNLTLAAGFWGIGLLLFLKPVTGSLLMFGAICLLGAVVASAKALFHLITVAITRLPDNLKAVSQVIVALIAATLPFAYLFPHETELTSGMLVKAFQGVSHWGFWLIMALFVYLTHKAALIFPKPLVPVRRYLFSVAVVFGIVFLAGHGALSTDEEGVPDVPLLDPKSTEGKMSMAANYLRLIFLAYGTIVYTEFRSRAVLKSR